MTCPPTPRRGCPVKTGEGGLGRAKPVPGDTAPLFRSRGWTQDCSQDALATLPAKGNAALVDADARVERDRRDAQGQECPASGAATEEAR
jgi:hypothetical protein